MIGYQVTGHTAILTIDRPEARNAVDGGVARGLEEAVDRLEADESIWTGILTGAGGVFSAGADLKVLAQGRDAEIFTKRGSFGGFVRLPRTKPMIAAVDGPALAGGCELALACDLIVASRASRFALPEVKRSLIASAGGLIRLPRILPAEIATHMLLTGDPIGAERAYELGMVCELTEPGQALEVAVSLAQRINANSPLAVRKTLQLIHDGAGQSFDEAWRQSRAAMRELAATEDFREGPRAFVEKRAPVWRGR